MSEVGLAGLSVALVLVVGAVGEGWLIGGLALHFASLSLLLVSPAGWRVAALKFVVGQTVCAILALTALAGVSRQTAPGIPAPPRPTRQRQLEDNLAYRFTAALLAVSLAYGLAPSYPLAGEAGAARGLNYAGYGPLAAGFTTLLLSRSAAKLGAGLLLLLSGADTTNVLAGLGLQAGVLAASGALEIVTALALARLTAEHRGAPPAASPGSNAPAA